MASTKISESEVEAEIRRLYSAKEMELPEARVADPLAWTIPDLQQRFGFGYKSASEYAKAHIASGKWEQTWQRSKAGRWLSAYRPAKRKK